MNKLPTLLALALCSMAWTAQAETIPATPLQAATPVKSHNINIQRWQLDNGAKVLLVERHE